MKVFLSWSGERSRLIAEAIRSWLPRVIQAVEPWMSEEDISSGTRWSIEIADKLESSSVGIVCVTPENQNSPWVMFEAGALSKTIDQSLVCPYLFGLKQSQVTGPLSQFQSNLADKSGTYRVLQSINKALQDVSLPEQDLEEIFDVWWEKLKAKIDQIPSAHVEQKPDRSVEDILEEVISNTREQLRREEVRLERSEKMDETFKKIIPILESYANVEQKLATMMSETNASISADGKLSLAGGSDAFKDVIGGLKGVQELDKHFTKKILCSDVDKEKD